MFDVGDLPVLSFGNCILKAECLSGLYVFLRFFTFFSKSKKHDFLRIFELLLTFSRTLAVFCIVRIRKWWVRVSQNYWINSNWILLSDEDQVHILGRTPGGVGWVKYVIYRVAQNKIPHQTICNIFATSGQILKGLNGFNNFLIWPLVAKILHIVWWGILFWATLYNCLCLHHSVPSWCRRRGGGAGSADVHTDVDVQHAEMRAARA